MEIFALIYMSHSKFDCLLHFHTLLFSIRVLNFKGWLLKFILRALLERWGTSLGRCDAQISVLIHCGAIYRLLRRSALCRLALGLSGTQRLDARVHSAGTLYRKLEI
ncbi:hypothetical protein IEQ34_017619 [Dendrobium chrysotoxum]|uniref:Uncharacterized protein n=1 Tax=Dendrobium chrysotoxum TaxID=161865 RepID=A0AAV7GAU8_DENCH|nr:hypothetical protein IEQ34_017619 [Dendrobium chrysotoxum]